MTRRYNKQGLDEIARVEAKRHAGFPDVKDVHWLLLIEEGRITFVVSYKHEGQYEEVRVEL